MAGVQDEVAGNRGAAPLDEAVFSFLDELQAVGFAIGIDEYLEAQEILVALADDEGDVDPVRLRNWMAAVFCGREEEQREFYQRFEDWWARATPKGRSLRPVAAAAPTALAPDVETEVERVIKWSGRTRWVVGAVLSIVLLIGGALWLAGRGAPSTSGPAPTESTRSTGPVPAVSTGTGERGSKSQPEAPPVGPQVRVSVTVRDEGGSPVPGARLAISGDSTVTNSSGLAELRLPIERLERGAADVVVTHANYLDARRQVDFTAAEPAGVDRALAFEATMAAALPTWLRRLGEHPRLAAVLLFAIPVVLAVFWALWRVRTRELVAERRSASERHLERDLGLARPMTGLYRTSAVVRARIDARRYRYVGRGDLDADATVDASVRRMRPLEPVHQQRAQLPAYLALVDRVSVRDQAAKAVDDLLDWLADGGVPIVRYYFDGDPRMCAPAQRGAPYSSLRELTSRYGDLRLLIFGDGGGLLNPVTGRLANWTSRFRAWSERALMTPVAVEEWSTRESEVARSGLQVLPATPAGIRAFVHKLMALGEGRIAGGDWSPPYPRVLSARPSRWLDRNPPRPEELGELDEQLRAYLDHDGYRWLCSLAVYPELSWHLTLQLGMGLRGADGAPLLSESRLLRLTRLQWLRHGRMPDWLRACLAERLSAEDEVLIRDALDELLATAVVGGAAAGQLHLARPSSEPRRRWHRLVMDLLRTEPEDSPLHDHVFVSFLNNRRPGRLQVRAPRTWHRWVFERSLPALGVRPALVLGAVVFVFGSVAAVVPRTIAAVPSPDGSQLVLQLDGQQGDFLSGAVDRTGPTLKQLLASDEQAGVIAVEEEGGLTRITLRARDLFASGSATLNTRYTVTLQHIAAAIDQVPGRTLVQGHTDDQPLRSSRYRDNFDLSRERAASVAKVMQPALQNPARLEWQGVGATEPRYLPSTPENRTRNRRVEIVHVSPPSLNPATAVALARGAATPAVTAADDDTASRRANLRQRYQADVLAECRALTDGRYPFAPTSPVDLPIGDFGRLFGYGGVFDTFFRNELVPLVDTTRRPWAWRGDAAGVSVGDLPLSVFEAAEQIREAFFRPGSMAPEVRFTLTPVDLDPSVRRFVLDIDGQRLENVHAPPRPVAMKWPGERPGAATAMFEETAGGRPTTTTQGPWAWFRLLDTARFEFESGERALVSFERGGHSARVRLETSSIRHPFGKAFLRVFRCG